MLSILPACYVYNNRTLEKASNSGYSSDSRVQVLSWSPSVQNSCQLSNKNHSAVSSQPPLQISTELPILNSLDCPSCLLHNSSARTISKTALFYSCCVFLSAGICVPSRCTKRAVCFLAHFIATVVLVVWFDVFVWQRVYAPLTSPSAGYVGRNKYSHTIHFVNAKLWPDTECSLIRQISVGTQSKWLGL
jgi:hypothetical protein